MLMRISELGCRALIEIVFESISVRRQVGYLTVYRPLHNSRGLASLLARHFGPYYSQPVRFSSRSSISDPSSGSDRLCLSKSQTHKFKPSDFISGWELRISD